MNVVYVEKKQRKKKWKGILVEDRDVLIITDVKTDSHYARLMANA